jgi:hypothetical protein
VLTVLEDIKQEIAKSGAAKRSWSCCAWQAIRACRIPGLQRRSVVSIRTVETPSAPD